MPFFRPQQVRFVLGDAESATALPPSHLSGFLSFSVHIYFPHIFGSLSSHCTAWRYVLLPSGSCGAFSRYSHPAKYPTPRPLSARCCCIIAWFRVTRLPSHVGRQSLTMPHGHRLWQHWETRLNDEQPQWHEPFFVFGFIITCKLYVKTAEITL